MAGTAERGAERVQPRVDLATDRARVRRRVGSGRDRGAARKGRVHRSLGLIEAWFDTQTGSYLNRKPPKAEFDAAPERYVLRVFDVDDAYPMLESAFSLVAEADLDVVVTVSPVPLYATFSGEDAIIANSLSKAVLRVCAHRLADRFPRVDYFPSYEIATSGGLANFYRDQLHVRSDVVSTITRYMVSLYERPRHASESQH